MNRKFSVTVCTFLYNVYKNRWASWVSSVVLLERYFDYFYCKLFTCEPNFSCASSCNHNYCNGSLGVQESIAPVCSVLCFMDFAPSLLLILSSLSFRIDASFRQTWCVVLKLLLKGWTTGDISMCWHQSKGHKDSNNMLSKNFDWHGGLCGC